VKGSINTREANGDADAKSQVTMTPLPNEKTYPAGLKALLERGNAGDLSVLPALIHAPADTVRFALLRVLLSNVLTLARTVWK